MVVACLLNWISWHSFSRLYGCLRCLTKSQLNVGSWMKYRSARPHLLFEFSLQTRMMRDSTNDA